MRGASGIVVLLSTLALMLGVGIVSLGRDTREVQAAAVVRWGYYVYYDDTSYESLSANIDQLDIVSAYYYHLTPGGTIKSFAEPQTTRLIQNSNVKIVPMIQNEAQFAGFHDQIDTSQERDDIVHKLYALVRDNGYDGIHVDFEGVSETDRDLLTDLMRRLHGAFEPQGWIVSQAVFAKVSDRSPNYWAGAYDYAALAEYNDYITVMTYDYGYRGRPDPVAVAPIWWMQDVIEFATTLISPEKLLLGVNLYGYDWNTTKGPPATSVSFAQATALASRPGATSGYDAEVEAAWVRYRDDGGDDHQVWYENADSFAAKLRVMTDHGLGGFATWRLGHEDPAVWGVVASLQTPATRIPPFDDSDERIYFAQTGHSVAYGFLEYWREHGGLARFGYPRTEEFTEFDPMVGANYTVQYFERARFEFHPEYAGTPFEVLLGHTGRWALERRGEDPWESATDPKAGARYFPETGHNLDDVFLDYWESRGGLYAFGFPISEELQEVNPEDGITYTVQYFERARFEYHPEFAGTEFEVLLGLLGNEMLRERSWIR
jgi:spore germination protein YaaH